MPTAPSAAAHTAPVSAQASTPAGAQAPTHPAVGLSGMVLYVPRFRVPLERWCDWTGKPWDKISAVVGRSFRMAGSHESIYTMAANAVLRLIERYDVDPETVGFLGFGTESSTDNAAGAVIVRGMVDQALLAQNRAPLSRACEVPEVKHACLGGIYALKGALRYLATDGAGRKAIVVTGDIAEYERGSTGEQTQGAGTVAMLLDEDPQLCRLDLRASGSSSNYRGLDFRKPFGRHEAEHYTPNVTRLHDFPVFNGKYSTFCYLDAVTHAVANLTTKLGEDPVAFFQRARSLFFHRPYHWMPVQAMASLYVWSLTVTEAGHAELRDLCADCDADFDAVVEELSTAPGAGVHFLRDALARGIHKDPAPESTKVARAVRKLPVFAELRAEKMSLGTDKMMEIGNIYTAALPGWIAAGFEQAVESDEDLTGQTLVAVGYGSGDAAEALTMAVCPGWRDAAAKIGFDAALAGAIDLNQAQYEALHDGLPADGLDYVPAGEFVVSKVGAEVAARFQDIGVEYYNYVPPVGATGRNLG